MFELRKLRRSCERRLANLPLPDPFTLDGLVANVEEKLGRRIHLVPIEDDGDMRTACGLRVRTQEETFVFYRRRPSVVQEEHIILHELTHELFNHTTDLAEEQLTTLVPRSAVNRIVGLGGKAVLQARARYDTDEEEEAELGAYIMGRLSNRCRAPIGDDLVSQLERTLCHPVASAQRVRS
ncbi:hypothetical protein [Streptomyces sp. N2A]|uniref:hypothetical protein n=1 Tax=Streptomyces sp. N2A TaxID=3073936 RepID=UPI002870A671|nr:hypothetical protein [Streptomyces sp. N2A]